MINNASQGATDVLIAGAGPTGLVLAFWLTRLGIKVRIVDKAPEPGQSSRAIAVAARTLELYRQLGVATDVVDRGLQLAAVNLWVDGKHEGRGEFGAIGAGLSPFPYVLTYPQDEHERLLIARLGDLGVQIERPTELVALIERSDRISVRLRRADGSETVCDAAYLAGCDGARSSVRQILDVGFPGGTYPHLFYVADVEATGPQLNREVHLAFAEDGDFVVCFGLHDAAHARLIGTVRQDVSEKGDSLDWADVHKHVIDRIGLTVRRVNWFSTYRVHHRVASSFRVGRAFLLGDAAHIHSPVGGQGMNTGIGDASNLAWKLAAALRGKSDPRILSSYEEERIPFARLLVRTTDRVFEFVTAEGPLARKVRVGFAPQLLARLFRSASVRRFLFRTVSQTRVNYRGSWLSEGHAGRVHGGDRLPWVTGVTSDGAGDNFEPLSSLGWQLHVYGSASGDLRGACAARGLPVHVFRWDERAESTGVARDGAYLVRPDGYVALAAAGRDARREVERYLEARAIRPAA
jgi:2-polyprenyl-6-methoxyphenol hydroxylase-like FAD-dependent oxidoreductase